jgi:glutamine amidotransferase
MKKKIAIVDYGLGNLFSIRQACERVGLDPVIASDTNIIGQADGLILPGVGAFGDAMSGLKTNNLIDPLYSYVKSGKPFLGICLGMQLLFTQSEEFGLHNGLDLIKGTIIKFPKKNSKGEIVRVPQIQWNQIYKNTVEIWRNSPLKNLNDGAYMHFVHSYYAVPENEETVLSYSEYEGVRYASAVKKDNIIGIQYHPEKSGKSGIEIYQSWANFLNNKSY